MALAEKVEFIEKLIAAEKAGLMDHEFSSSPGPCKVIFLIYESLDFFPSFIQSVSLLFHRDKT